MPEQSEPTDLSEHSYDDLTGMEYSILRELASEREGVNGNGSAEEIAAGLLIADGREEEVGEEGREYYPDVYGDGDEPEETDEEESDDEPDDDAEEAESEPDDDVEDDEPEDTEEESGGRSPARQRVEPRRDCSFIIEASTLDAWIEKVDAVVDETKVHLTQGGVWSQAVDAANVGMVRAELSPSDFESFDVGQEGVIGINTGRIASIVGSADADQLLHLTYRAETRHLIIEYGSHKFTVALINPESIRQEPDLPDLDLPFTVEVDAGEFADSITFVNEVSDHLQLSYDGDDRALVVYGEGDTDDYEGTLEAGDEATFHDEPTRETVSLFSMDYMKPMTGVFDTDQEVLLRIGQELPVIMEASTGDETDGDVTYMLAPRIQSD